HCQHLDPGFAQEPQLTVVVLQGRQVNAQVHHGGENHTLFLASLSQVELPAARDHLQASYPLRRYSAGISSACRATCSPGGICTVDRRLSNPWRWDPGKGTPMTGRVVAAARTPARWAAMPAAARMTCKPRPAASRA